MEATFVTFPGSMRRVPVEGVDDKTTLKAFLEAAGETFAPGNKSDYAVNGQLTTDPNTEVPNGATVTKTSRVEGGGSVRSEEPRHRCQECGARVDESGEAIEG